MDIPDIDESISDDESDRRASERFACRNGTFTLSEIQVLLTKAEDHYRRRAPFQQVQWIYRDKPKRFFDEADRNNGIMKAYEKDNSGDPKCPINRRIDGLFFGTYQMPMTSNFGDTQVKVPATFFFSGRAKKNNLQRLRIYFSDFYCMDRHHQRHWVTLVVTYKGSVADQFCRSKLPRIRLSDNQFLKFENGSIWLRNAAYDRIEIYYTEDIDLRYWQANNAVISSVIPEGRGSSTPGGKPKNRFCPTCNLR